MDKLKETIIIDDIIPADKQDEFHNLVMKGNWTFVDDMTYPNVPQKYPTYGFNQMFKHPSLGVVSPLYEAVSVPIANALIEKTKIEVKDLFYNRAFLQVPLENKFVMNHNGIHIDIPEPHYACVYYMNDVDGDTIIYEQTYHNVPFGSLGVKTVEHKRVTPKKGRIVMFDGTRYHCSSQPREKYRCIINFDLV